ncbi:MAG: isoprenylcysteine carboxylmethyltransferase family protein [Bacteriovorax sp.]|nr:isoprenylcysteine carboxylmethyltransferase family protein [Bacteriovorax sp.]
MLIAKLVNYSIIFMFVIERLIELSVNQFNKKIMISKYAAKIKFPKEALQMRIFHTLWFVSLLAETYISGKMLTGFWFYFCVSVLILAQALRWYAIYTLGSNWSVDIYQMKAHPIIESGPYAYIRHPNYRKSVSKLLKIILVTIQSQNSKPMFFSSAYIGS